MRRPKTPIESGNTPDIGTIRLLLRCFFLQSSWNIKRMQNLGFLNAILPALKRIYRHDAQGFQEACGRHLELFNTHPYMAAPILGAVVQMEAQKEQGAVSLDTIRDFKRGAMIAFAAMGDALFWRTLRPLCAASAIAFALADFLWAPLVFLVSYNTAHLFVRGYGLRVARRNGIRVIELINRWNIPKRIVQLRLCVPVALGAVSAKCALVAPEQLECVMPILALPFVMIACILIQRRVSVPIILASTFVLLTAAILFFSSE